ncbi:hypothetical protein FACS1894133_7690 [Clostridia bacterium]|nr:hypothetical protein FACS1894133_7690 [Clostridia bacterium]
MNRVILMGRLCYDVELKTTPTGIPVLSNRLAVDRNFQAKGEERKSDFFSIVAWRSNAEFISRWFAKGRMILIEGELQTRHYTDKNNLDREVTEIVIDKAHFTGEKTNTAGSRDFALPPPPTDAPPYSGTRATGDFGAGGSSGGAVAAQGGGFGANNVAPFPNAPAAAAGIVADTDDSEEYPF